MLWKEIAKSLLIRVYYPVSAVAGVSVDGGLRSISLFDTEFASPCMPDADAAEIWFFTHHPEGYDGLYETDWTHIRVLQENCPGRSLRVFITNEDFICREYQLLPPSEM